LTTELWNREELYAEIWERPLVKVAVKYGVSAVALGKVCRKLQIPLPGRGYWTKKEFGKPVERQPLPPANNLPVVKRMKDCSVGAEQDPFVPNVDDPELLRIAEIETANVTVDEAAKLHKLVSDTRRILRHSRTDDRDILQPQYDELCLHIRVSKSALDRGLRLMNALILKLESEGFPVSMQNGRDSTGVMIFGQRVPFSMIEKVHVKNRREVKEYSWTRTVVDYDPTGLLEFRIGGYGQGIRRTWGDGKTRKLESLLNRCVGALMREGRRLQIQAELSKQQELERQKKQRELAELAVLIDEEEKKVRDLDTWVTNWARAEQIRGFISALEKIWTQQGHDLSPDEPKGKRIVWMKQQADRLDPMLPSPASILDRKGELPRW
jgi:hypothetical protein